MRSDCGTENVHVATYHMAFRSLHNDVLAGQKSFIYGRSSANIVSQYNVI